MVIKHITAIFLLCFWMESGASGLLDIYRRAKMFDPIYDAEKQTLEVMRQRAIQSRAGLLPSVSISGVDNATRAKTTFDDASSSLDRNVKSWNWSIQLTQPIFRLQNIFSYKEAESLLYQAEARFSVAEQDLILRVIQAYFDAAVAEEDVVAANFQIKALQEQQEQAKKLFSAGISAITDVYEANAKIGLAEYQKVLAENDRDSKRAVLEKITGEMPGELKKIPDGVVVPKISPANPESWVFSAQKNNPMVVDKIFAVNAAEADLSKNRSEHLPTLDFVASYGGNYSSGSLTTPADYSTRARSNVVGVQINIPIYSGGAVNAKVAEARANHSKAIAELESAKRQAAMEARQAYLGVISGISQITALEAAVEAGKVSVKGNRAGYQVGVRINLDVLNAEQQLYSSKRDLIKARYETLMQGIKLKSAVGTLGEDDVRFINSLLLK